LCEQPEAAGLGAETYTSQGWCRTMEEASDLESELGGRATVTALVRRTQLPELTIELHRLLSGVDFDLRRHDVLLPGSTRSFGLVAGSAWKPAQGVIEDLGRSGRSAVRVKGEVFGSSQFLTLAPTSGGMTPAEYGCNSIPKMGMTTP